MRYKAQNEFEIGTLSKATSGKIMKWRDEVRQLKDNVYDAIDPFFDSRGVPIVETDVFGDVLDWWLEIHNVSQEIVDAVYKDTRVESQDFPQEYVDFYNEWGYWDDLSNMQFEEVYNKLELIEPAMTSLEDFLDRGMDAMLSIRTLVYMGAI